MAKPSCIIMALQELVIKLRGELTSSMLVATQTDRKCRGLAKDAVDLISKSSKL